MGGIPLFEKTHENRANVPIELRGIYVHKLLVNHIAMWASPKYAIYIAQLFDSLFKRQREQLKQKIEEQKPRMVPENNKNDYKYLIWKESSGKKDFTRLHLVRRHKSTWKKVVAHQKNKEELFYFKDDLPIFMTPNLNIKKIIKASFVGDDYKVVSSGNAVDIKTEHLPKLHELVEKYFSSSL